MRIIPLYLGRTSSKLPGHEHPLTTENLIIKSKPVETTKTTRQQENFSRRRTQTFADRHKYFLTTEKKINHEEHEEHEVNKVRIA